jgi:hypothetical protein
MTDASSPSWASAALSAALPDLCTQGESQHLEFKRALPAQGHEIAKSIAAFASSNPGRLIFGVADDGTIAGLPEATSSTGRDDIQQRVMGAAKEIKPSVHPTVAWAVYEGRIVCVVGVERGIDALYYVNQRAIVRRGSSSRPAEPGEVDLIYRQRYAASATAASLPSTKQIAERMRRILDLMNDRRDERLTVADLARALGLSAPAELDAVFAGQTAASFPMLDQFCARFAVDKDWLATGRGNPFSSPVEHRASPEDYLGLIEEAAPEYVYLVRSASDVGEALIVVGCDSLKCWSLPDVWHVSNHVGAGGSHALLSLYKLFRRWSEGSKPYMVLGRLVDPRLADALINGKAHPGVVGGLPLSHWWDDLTDIEHKWTTRKGSARAYGESFVAAQDIVRAMLERYGG